jgi:hypothetical protein
LVSSARLTDLVAPVSWMNRFRLTADSIDILTVISGEIWAAMETGETLVGGGDAVIQLVSWHA